MTKHFILALSFKKRISASLVEHIARDPSSHSQCSTMAVAGFMFVTPSPIIRFSSFTPTIKKPRHRHPSLFHHQRQNAQILCASNPPNNNNNNNDDKGEIENIFSNMTPISRRQAIQLLNGVLGIATIGLLVKMREQFRLISPKSALSAFGFSLLPSRTLAARAASKAKGETTEVLPPLNKERVNEARAYLERVATSQPRISCPDFPSGSDWINSRPLSLRRELQGKLVVLDFFTYCCINCQHVLPKLAALESKYGMDGRGGVVVVGVHSAKFSAERDTMNIAAAVERYDVRHPVINDSGLKLWNELGISSWPTLMLIGPDMNVLALWSGERQEGDIDAVLTAAISYYGNNLNLTPLPSAPERGRINGQMAMGVSPLRYPGKIECTKNGKFVYVSDSANHRIVCIDGSTGNIIRIYGNGNAGLRDCDAGMEQSEAMFHSPQGIALGGDEENVLYVADTESHAVRKVDLKSGSVRTIGGTGEQGFDYIGGKIGKEQPLSSPWDVEVYGTNLYVAMAGTHQIWTIPISSSDEELKTKWQVFSGTGRELEKNSSIGRSASWAQPSHLSASSSQMLMFIADSESSSVRAVDMNGEKYSTRTLAGGDGLIPENLFSFGDKEGKGSAAKFQHPLAVVSSSNKNDNNIIYVADSYNHRIKKVDISNGMSKDFVGSGTPGFNDGMGKKAQFWEPSGLALSEDGEKLFVADTNNFAVRVVDTKTANVSTLNISSSMLAGTTESNKNSKDRLIANRRRAVKIACDDINTSTTTLQFEIELPKQSHFTPGTVSKFQVNVIDGNSSDDNVIDVVERGTITHKKETGPGLFTVDLKKIANRNSIQVEAVTYYCTEVDDVCRVESDIFTFGMAKGSDGTDKTTTVASVTHTITPRKNPSLSPSSPSIV